MGCLQDKGVHLDFDLRNENYSKNQEFKIDLEEGYTGVTMTEETLLSERAPVVELFSEINDIRAVNREDQLRVSSMISRNSVKKLRKAKDFQSEFLIDPKLIIDAVNSAR